MREAKTEQFVENFILVQISKYRWRGGTDAMRLFVQKYKKSTVLRLGHYVDVEIYTKVITVTIKTYSMMRELKVGKSRGWSMHNI